MNRPQLTLAAAISALGMCWMPAASAQAPSAPPMEAQQPSSSYSDAELKSFAVAALDVQRIRDTYLPRLHAAATPEEQQKVRIEASNQMVQAVEQRGLSVDKYTEIARQAQARPEIAEQIQRHVDEAAAK